MLSFRASAPSPSAITGPASHLVVCEAGEPLSEVIAANYAFALGAGLSIIPTINKDEAADLMEGYYRIGGDPEIHTSALLGELQARLRAACGAIPVPRGGSVTFISRTFRWEQGFPRSRLPTCFNIPISGLP